MAGGRNLQGRKQKLPQDPGASKAISESSFSFLMGNFLPFVKKILIFSKNLNKI